MTENRGMTIFFIDGSKTSITFPPQAADDFSVIAKMDRILERQQLLVEAEGGVFIFPFSNIKYIQVFPAPSKLPDYVIKGATIEL